jgi:hypothetical protein
MKAMNSLGSWIDHQQMVIAAQDLAAPASLADEFALLLTGPSQAPPKALRVEDFRIGPPLPDMPPQEKMKVRHLLEGVKRRAQNSGLLGGSAPSTNAPQPQPADPPMLPLSAVLPSLPPLPPLPVVASAKPAVAPAAAPAEDQEGILSRRGLPFFVPPVGPLATRIRALMDWLKRQVTADSMFIIDAQGCPVSDAEPSPEILASAVVLSEAARRAARHVPTAGEGALHIDLPNSKKLCVIHTETSYGYFCLGLVLAEALNTSTADRLRRALQRTVEADGETGPVKVERF